MKTQIQQVFMNLIDNAPTLLDTRNELATALADVAKYAAKIQSQLATQSPKSAHDESIRREG